MAAEPLLSLRGRIVEIGGDEPFLGIVLVGREPVGLIPLPSTAVARDLARHLYREVEITLTLAPESGDFPGVP